MTTSKGRAAAVVLLVALATTVHAAPVAERIYLSGTGPADAVEWEFKLSKGRGSGEWTTIPVPSNWEQHGFGNYNYGDDEPASKHDESGTYRTTFTIPEAWQDKHVRLVFEGSMTQTSIRINGKPVGAPNHGGYLPFRFILDETNIEYGKENVLEVLVKKKPDNESLDQAERKADYWVFGGIYRPVYLEVQPRVFVNRLAIDAQADGTLRLDVFPQVQYTTRFRQDLITYVDEVIAQVQTLDGSDVGEPMSAAINGGSGRIRLGTKTDNPKLWSPEYPNLYQVKVTLKYKGEPISEKTERFGYRTIELRPEDGLYLNGTRILVKGINRNVFDPEDGRAIDAEKVWAEARAIKAMNANLVRSHLPPTFEFMRASDELGLMIITELTTWHDPAIDTPIARNIAYELVTNYQNHPSVILWANGNENGFNLEIDELYHLYDLQNRPVIHPWVYFEGIDTSHYPNYDEMLSRLQGPVVYLPTEFLHGLYDGGHGAGLEDYWTAVRESKFGAGGVLWCWADAAISRTDMDGRLDTFGNRSADGIVGPHGEKEASYFTVREIWSPVQIDLDTLPQDFDGRLPVENRYYETLLDERSFEWRLLDLSDSTVRASARFQGPGIEPGASGTLKIPLPDDWRDSDALELAAVGPDGVEIMRWSWAVGTPPAIAVDTNVLPEQDEGNPFAVRAGNIAWSFSPRTGQLLSATIDGEETGFAAGPTLYAGTLDGALEISHQWNVTAIRDGDLVVVKTKSEEGSWFRWEMSPGGTATLDYSFSTVDQELAYLAVGFDLPEDVVSGKQWLGDGPHRVWGNRLKGPQYGRWGDTYNDIVPGVDWGKPEFKGIFANVDWMQIDLKSGNSIVLDTASGTSVGVLRPGNAEGGELNKNSRFGPVHAWWHYPEGGGLHLFHKLPGTGSKFYNAEHHGPQGSPSIVPGPISGRVIFRLQ